MQSVITIWMWHLGYALDNLVPSLTSLRTEFRMLDAQRDKMSSNFFLAKFQAEIVKVEFQTDGLKVLWGWQRKKEELKVEILVRT